MIFYIVFCANVAFADVIDPGSILRPPAERWKSVGGNFSLGFYGKENENYVVGISFANINDNTLVWTAGQGGVVDGASLQFQSDGDLVLFDHLNNAVWKSNTSNKGVVSAEMRDNGNFVLLNRSSDVVWESFGNPTDTLVVDQNFTMGKSLSAYPYSLTLEGVGNLTLKWRNNITYLNDGAYGAGTLSLTKQGILKLSNSSVDSLWMARSNDYTDNTITTRRVTLDSDGNLRMYGWNAGSQSWESGWSAVKDQCRVYGYCGNYGVCEYNSTGPHCVCPSLDFTSVDSNDPRQGCKRLDDIGSCAHNQSMLNLEHTEFLMYPPESDQDSAIFFLGNPDCWENCLKNPSCSASTILSDGSGTCQLIMTTDFNSAYSSVNNPSLSYLKVCGAGRPTYDLLSPPPSLPSPGPEPEPEPETGLEVQIYIYVGGQYYPIL